MRRVVTDDYVMENLSAKQLADKIKSESSKSGDSVQAVYERIEKYDPLNKLVSMNP